MNEDANAEQPSNQNDHRNNPSRAAEALALFALVATAAIGIGLMAFNPFEAKPSYDQSAALSRAPNATYDEIVAQLDEATSKSRLWISVASTMSADASTGTVRASNGQGQPIDVLDNLPENSRDLRYSFTLDDGTCIYQSQLIQPGQSIASPVLDDCPSPGAYDVTVTAQGYDVESHNAVGGTVAAKATLNVE